MARKKKPKPNWRSSRNWPVLPLGSPCPKTKKPISFGACKGCGLFLGLGYFLEVRCESKQRERVYFKHVKSLFPQEKKPQQPSLF